MTKFKFSLVTLSLLATAGCKSRSHSPTRVKEINTNDLSEYEVVDCTPSLCGQDMAVVGINPSDRDLSALGVKDSPGSLALDDGGAVQEVKGSEAENALEKSQAAHGVMAATMSDGPKSQAIKAGMTGLFASLSAIANQASAVNKFASENIIAASDEQRANTLKKVSAFAGRVKDILPKLEPGKVSDILDAFQNLGGKDGWVNRGDLPRFLPVIPNIVGKVADEKIQDGYAEGIANLARTRPFAYKRWVRRPNGIIGSVVQRNIDKELNVAYSQKYAAIRGASDQFQSVYNQLMTDLGVTSYFLNVNDSKKYYDPGNAVDEIQINKLSRAMSGRSLDEVVRGLASNPSAMSSPQLNFPVLDEISSQVTLPDGLPIEQIAQLVKDSQGFTKTILPTFLSFKLLADGKLEIRRKTSDQRGESQTGTSPMESEAKPQPSDVKCLAITTLGSGNVKMFLYSSIPGSGISLITGNGPFVMPWSFDAQPTWPLVKGGFANLSWRNEKSAYMDIQGADGKTHRCEGAIVHQ